MSIPQRVEVYRNLHKNCFSVRALNGDKKGKVIDHVKSITLKEATFAVQPAGRKRVLKEKRKNVHAFIRGIPTNEPLEDSYEVKYDPYLNNTFVMKKPTWAKESLDFLVTEVYSRQLYRVDGTLAPVNPKQKYTDVVIKQAQKVHLSFIDDGHSRIEVLP
jgi:hypothetical protein